MIKIEGLNKSFGSFQAVKSISFKIDRGDILGLLGPNGAGKSTTINLISGILKKDSGEVNILGKNIEREMEKIKEDLGVVPQDLALFYDLTARENLMYFGSLYGLRGKNLKERVSETLDFVGLKDVQNKFPNEFSGGMKRRLNIGCAIVHQPKLIILDEPTVGIDAQSRNHILETIKELNRRGSTIIYTSHYMEEVETICNKIVIIDGGSVIEQGLKNEILEKYNQSEKIKIHLSRELKEGELERLKSLEDVVDITLNKDILKIKGTKNGQALEKTIAFLSELKIGLLDVDIRKKNLEDIFLELTGRNLRE